MKMKPVILALAAASLGVSASQGQTTLSVGDISFISAEADVNGAVADGYSIVTWKDLAAGTVLKFTDNGMSNAAATAANTSEHAWTFTVGVSSIAAGTTLSFGYASPTASKWNGPASGTTSTNLSPFTNSGISASGDQLFVYQGTGTNANLNSTPANAGAFTGTLISGINFGTTVSSGPLTGNASNETYAPTSLVNGNAYVSVGNLDNAYYNGTRTGLSNILYRAATTNLTNFTATETLNASYDRTSSFTINNAASIHWDANGATLGDGGTGTWDSTTNDRFKDGAAGTTRFRWVNSTTGNDHTAVFGGTAGTVTVSGGVTASGLKFDTTGYTLTGSTIALSGSTAPTIDTGAGAATVGSALAGTQGITKLGTGTLTLGTTNNYTGDTTIKAGTLKLGASGTIAGSTAIVVGDGGSSGTVLDTTDKAGFTISNTQSLKGIGAVNVGSGKTLTIEGKHAPGNVGTDGGVGTQAVAGSLSYASGAIFEWDLNANSTSTGFDKASATGTVAVSTTDTVFKVIFGTTALTGVQNPGNTFWNTAFGTQEWSMATIFGQGLQSGSRFASVETSHDVSAYGSFSINGSNLTWTAVPEPSSALAGLLIAAGLLRRRRVV